MLTRRRSKSQSRADSPLANSGPTKNETEMNPEPKAETLRTPRIRKKPRRYEDESDRDQTIDLAGTRRGGIQGHKPLEPRKKTMRRSSRARRLVDGDKDNTQGTSSTRIIQGGKHKEIIQPTEGTPTTIGTPPAQAQEQPCSRSMTAKMRWKDRARSTSTEKEADPSVDQTSLEELNVGHPSPSASPSALDSQFMQKDPPQTTGILRKTRCKTSHSQNNQQIHKRRKLDIPILKSRREESQQYLKAMRQERARRQQIKILKRLKTWLTQNGFEHKDNVPGATQLKFLMTEDDREAFVQKMVEQCRNNTNLRSSFLDSVKMLAKSGVMHFAALNMLREGPCKEAQDVIKAWEDLKRQQPSSKELPMDLLHAVARLHERRRDLPERLTRFQNPEMCSLSHIHDSTWQIQLSDGALLENAELHEA